MDSTTNTCDQAANPWEEATYERFRALCLSAKVEPMAVIDAILPLVQVYEGQREGIRKLNGDLEQLRLVIGLGGPSQEEMRQNLQRAKSNIDSGFALLRASGLYG